MWTPPFYPTLRPVAIRTSLRVYLSKLSSVREVEDMLSPSVEKPFEFTTFLVQRFMISTVSLQRSYSLTTLSVSELPITHLWRSSLDSQNSGRQSLPCCYFHKFLIFVGLSLCFFQYFPFQMKDFMFTFLVIYLRIFSDRLSSREQHISLLYTVLQLYNFELTEVLLSGFNKLNLVKKRPWPFVESYFVSKTS